MERDDEVSGAGNSYTTEFRQYDPRLGRWMSLDPLFANFPWQSPYVAFDNNPIYFTDPLGLAAKGGDDKKEDELDKGKIGAEDTPFELHEITVTATRGSVTETPASKDETISSSGKETWAMRNGSWSSTCMCFTFSGASQQYWEEVENTKKALYTAAWVTVGSVGGAMALPATLSLGTSHFAKSSFFALADASLQYSITGNIDVISVMTNYIPGFAEMRLYSQSFNTFSKYLALRGGVAVVDGMVDYDFADKSEPFKIAFYNKSLMNVFTDASFSLIGQTLPDMAFGTINYKPKLKSTNPWDAMSIRSDFTQTIGFGLYGSTIIPANSMFKNQISEP